MYSYLKHVVDRKCRMERCAIFPLALDGLIHDYHRWAARPFLRAYGFSTIQGRLSRRLVFEPSETFSVMRQLPALASNPLWRRFLALRDAWDRRSKTGKKRACPRYVATTVRALLPPTLLSITSMLTYLILSTDRIH
jgi:uncharacterized protein YbdZ (MbtH family)